MKIEIFILVWYIFKVNDLLMYLKNFILDICI